MKGEVVTDQEKNSCKILTKKKEESIVQHVKNKNHCLQGISKKELTANKRFKPNNEDSDFSDETDEEYDQFVTSDEDVEDGDNNNVIDPVETAKSRLLTTGMEPPINEEEIRNQWYGVIYRGKREVLHVAKVLMRFLKVENYEDLVNTLML